MGKVYRVETRFATFEFVMERGGASDGVTFQKLFGDPDRDDVMVGPKPRPMQVRENFKGKRISLGPNGELQVLDSEGKCVVATLWPVISMTQIGAYYAS